MNPAVEKDVTDMEKKLKCYVDKGRVAGASEVQEEPTASVKPDVDLVKPLRKRSDFAGRFMAVDCFNKDDKESQQLGDLPDAAFLCGG